MAKGKIGTGIRFATLKNRLIKGGHSASSAEKIAAFAGMKKYGKKRMAKWAAHRRKG